LLDLLASRIFAGLGNVRAKDGRQARNPIRLDNEIIRACFVRSAPAKLALGGSEDQDWGRDSRSAELAKDPQTASCPGLGLAPRPEIEFQQDRVESPTASHARRRLYGARDPDLESEARERPPQSGADHGLVAREEYRDHAPTPSEALGVGLLSIGLL
jgi:hypothetical protein